MITPNVEAPSLEAQIVALIPRFRQEAVRIHRRFFASSPLTCDPEDVMQDMILGLLKRGQDESNAPIENFFNYARRSMLNIAKSIARKSERMPNVNEDIGEMDSINISEEWDATAAYSEEHKLEDEAVQCINEDKLANHALTLREVLDQIRWSRSSKQDIDFWCVWLLRMRLGFARTLHQPPTNLHRGETELIKRNVVWREDEEQSLFRKKWPKIRLKYVGDHVLESVCKHQDTSSVAVSASLSRFGKDSVSPDQWDQWSRRARKQAHQAAIDKNIDALLYQRLNTLDKG